MKAEVKAGPEQVMLHVGRRFATYRNVKYGRNSIEGVKEGATGVNSHHVPYKIVSPAQPSAILITHHPANSQYLSSHHRRHSTIVLPAPLIASPFSSKRVLILPSNSQWCML